MRHWDCWLALQMPPRPATGQLGRSSMKPSASCIRKRHRLVPLRHHVLQQLYEQLPRERALVPQARCLIRTPQQRVRGGDAIAVLGQCRVGGAPTEPLLQALSTLHPGAVGSPIRKHLRKGQVVHCHHSGDARPAQYCSLGMAAPRGHLVQSDLPPAKS